MMGKKTIIILAACAALLIPGSAFGVYKLSQSERFTHYVPDVEMPRFTALQGYGETVQSALANARSDIAQSLSFEWPSVSWPVIAMPEMTWPELPEITLPELPSIAWPEFFASREAPVEGERAAVPDVRLPETDLLDMPESSWGWPSLPEIAWPEITWPELPAMPELRIVKRTGRVLQAVQETSISVWSGMTGSFVSMGEHISTFLSYPLPEPLRINVLEIPAFKVSGSSDQDVDIAAPEQVAENVQPEGQEPALTIEDLTQIEPASGRMQSRYSVEEEALDIEGVLVPQASTVISSSRDGKIAKINFENGDMFEKGDVLVEYECKDIKAEMEVAQAEKELAETRFDKNEKLLKLDIISDIEHLGIKAEEVKASAQASIVENKIEKCIIRAAYDGRVTNRLANPHEFTRTDRVLMEVASLDDLDIEFLIPSRWLRWVNVDAPITIRIEETGEEYDAVIQRIHGEVDPVSQSIQLSAKLEDYQSPLLPGMSGTVHIDVTRIREAGILGFLEAPRYASRKDN